VQCVPLEPPKADFPPRTRTGPVRFDSNRDDVDTILICLQGFIRSLGTRPRTGREPAGVPVPQCNGSKRDVNEKTVKATLDFS